MKLLAISLCALVLCACSTLTTTGKSTDVADPTAVATANTTMTVAKFLANVQTIDCTTPPAAPVCVNAEATDTNGQVQAKTTTCLTSIAAGAAYTVIQRQLCSRLGIPVAPAVVAAPPK